jgi:hypothetical protein
VPTVSPSTEACEAIRDRINSGSGYVLDVQAQVVELLIEDLAELRSLRVEVVPENEAQLADTIDLVDRTSHQIRVWIRQKLQTTDQDEIEKLKWTRRQIALRLMNHVTTDGRVRVWEVDNQNDVRFDREALQQDRAFVSSIVLRVEVNP